MPLGMLLRRKKHGKLQFQNMLFAESKLEKWIPNGLLSFFVSTVRSAVFEMDVVC